MRDHFAILKVGPALTFAFREAVFALAMMENELFPSHERSNIISVLDAGHGGAAGSIGSSIIMEVSRTGVQTQIQFERPHPLLLD